MGARTPLDLGRLMAVAVAILDADGVDALTLSNVAARLGVGPSALYTHVDGVAGLHRAAAVESTNRLTRELRDAAIGRGGGEAVRSVAAAYRGYARRHPGRFAATLRIDADADHHELGRAHDELEAVFVAIVEAGGRRGDPARRLARNVRRSIHGFVVLEHATGSDPAADDDYRALVESLCVLFDS